MTCVSFDNDISDQSHPFDGNTAKPRSYIDIVLNFSAQHTAHNDGPRPIRARLPSLLRSFLSYRTGGRRGAANRQSGFASSQSNPHSPPPSRPSPARGSVGVNPTGPIVTRLRELLASSAALSLRPFRPWRPRCACAVAAASASTPRRSCPSATARCCRCSCSCYSSSLYSVIHSVVSISSHLIASVRFQPHGCRAGSCGARPPHKPRRSYYPELSRSLCQALLLAGQPSDTPPSISIPANPSFLLQVISKPVCHKI
jgi:hypothetical protein